MRALFKVKLAEQLAIYMTEQQRRWARIVETTRISVD
jgi:hypothetical protein